MSLTDNIYWALPYWLKNAYYRTRDFFSPRQKWLTKKIGRSYMDKVELVKIVAFESIIDFIEQEKAFEVIEWSATEPHTEAAKAFKKAYHSVRIKIPVLEKREEAWWKHPDLVEYFGKGFLVAVSDAQDGHRKRYQVGTPTEAQQAALDALRATQAEIEELTQEVVEIVAKYRNYMWT